jgi:hypothetical protein
MGATVVHPDAPSDRHIADIRKNKNEVARVQLRTYENTRLIDIRAFAQGDGSDLSPTKKGICLNVRLIGPLIEALTKAETAARQMGWLAADDSPRKAA